MKQPRFWKDRFRVFFDSLAPITEASHVRTSTELVAAEIQESIREDVVPFARRHESGNDVKSIAENKIETLGFAISRELRDSELQMITDMELVVKDFLFALQERKAELEHGTAGGAYGRVLELRKAEANVRTRERSSLTN